MQGTKRRRTVFSGSVLSDGVDAHRGVCERQDARAPLLPEYSPFRADDEMSSVARAGAGMKVELRVTSPTDDGDGVREFCEHTAP